LTLKGPSKIDLRFPFEIVSLPRRRLVLGLATTAAGYLAATGIVICGIALLGLERDSQEISIFPLWILGYALWVGSLVFAGTLAQRLDARGRRMRQWDALSALQRDRRPPVLFLRSFDDDDIHDLTGRTGRIGLHRGEENLCRALRRLGPVVAIGRPGERLPEVGAARLYVSDRTWQVAVRCFLEQAQVVVIMVGRSSGVRWEIQTALNIFRPEGLLFYFPFSAPKGSQPGIRAGLRMLWLRARELQAVSRERDERYSLFRREVGSALAGRLPDHLGGSQFVDFLGPDEPRLIPTVKPSTLDSILQLSLTNAKVGVHFERTLEPFFGKQPRDPARPVESRAVRSP
jgi:hypothetical protein